MYKDKVYKIRPSGRHLLTIGRDLIHDNYAAIVELVKNAYDADSKDVEIHFLAQQGTSPSTSNNKLNSINIIIRDHGHGMNQDIIINNWMVPSTKDKLNRKTSPNGRILQGRKGIGRYAASRLGSTLLLETISNDAQKNTVFINWHDFEECEYLDDIEIHIKTTPTTESVGTTLTISGGEEYFQEWNKKTFDKLKFELKKLISPIGDYINKSTQEFQIKLIIEGFSDQCDTEEYITPYPIFELFDYKISGAINSNGKGVLTYSSQKARNSVVENMNFDLGEATLCGNLIFDIRVYDREAASIEQLIERGLKDNDNNYVGKLRARQILNESNGIGVYRNGFRIRPLGDPEFDWLKLNEQRVQNPSLRIGSNQVIGYVLIESEENSSLIEKSARDGLLENIAYQRLRRITKEVIELLESRRFLYRRKIGLSKANQKIETELDSISSLSHLKHTIQEKFNSHGMSTKLTDDIIHLINKEEEEKIRSVEAIRQTVATYQGHATLGKIINVVLHEGRRPLNYFRNEIPRIDRFIKKYEENKDKKNLDEIIVIAKKTYINADMFVNLFKRLDPLASNNRPNKREISLKDEIMNCFAIFKTQMEAENISFQVNGDGIIMGWKQDIYAIFTNLIDNSIFWMSEKSLDRKEIIINLVSETGSLSYIDFYDTGPGIEPVLIKNGLIFEPHFTTKPSGTGIGLSIAGEAAARNGLKLMAFETEHGAYFRLDNVIKE